MNNLLMYHQHLIVAVIAIYIAQFLIGVGLLCLFYARMRDIAEELRKLRAAYEAANPPQPKPPGTQM